MAGLWRRPHRNGRGPRASPRTGESSKTAELKIRSQRTPSNTDRPADRGPEASAASAVGYYRQYGHRPSEELRFPGLQTNATRRPDLRGRRTSNFHQHKNPESLGGNQRRCRGSLLLTDPEILIVDEPTRGIDVGRKRKFICRSATGPKRQGHYPHSSEMSRSWACRSHPCDARRIDDRGTDREDFSSELTLKYAIQTNSNPKGRTTRRRKHSIDKSVRGFISAI